MTSEERDMYINADYWVVPLVLIHVRNESLSVWSPTIESVS